MVFKYLVLRIRSLSMETRWVFTHSHCPLFSWQVHPFYKQTKFYVRIHSQIPTTSFVIAKLTPMNNKIKNKQSIIKNSGWLFFNDCITFYVWRYKRHKALPFSKLKRWEFISLNSMRADAIFFHPFSWKAASCVREKNFWVLFHFSSIRMHENLTREWKYWTVTNLWPWITKLRLPNREGRCGREGSSGL